MHSSFSRPILWLPMCFIGLLGLLPTASSLDVSVGLRDNTKSWIRRKLHVASQEHDSLGRMTASTVDSGTLHITRHRQMDMTITTDDATAGDDDAGEDDATGDDGQGDDAAGDDGTDDDGTDDDGQGDDGTDDGTDDDGTDDGNGDDGTDDGTGDDTQGDGGDGNMDDDSTDVQTNDNLDTESGLDGGDMIVTQAPSVYIGTVATQAPPDSIETVATQAPPDFGDVVTEAPSQGGGNVATPSPTPYASLKADGAGDDGDDGSINNDQTANQDTNGSDNLDGNDDTDNHIQVNKWNYGGTSMTDLQDQGMAVAKDPNVWIAAVVLSVVGFFFMLFVVHQLVENPNGCISKMFRCLVAFFRIICWPCRRVCCCCCPGGQARGRGRSGRTGVPTDDDDSYSRDLELT
ncbi:hypothetical protein MPSEU_000879200 [Mayamaea pseudoterrestris]|nr:hypothetical protein MPSEU_000879200 [Mayamaea pseudoterrestris]